jgi:hypothetical protein
MRRCCARFVDGRKRNWVTDTAALERAIPELAREALDHLPADPLTRLEYEFRCQLVSGQYEAALTALQGWHEARPAPGPSEIVEPFLRQEIFARAKLLEAGEGISYSEVLTKVIAQKFSTLDDRHAVDAAWALELPPGVARANLAAGSCSWSR